MLWRCPTEWGGGVTLAGHAPNVQGIGCAGTRVHEYVHMCVLTRAHRYVHTHARTHTYSRCMHTGSHAQTCMHTHKCTYHTHMWVHCLVLGVQVGYRHWCALLSWSYSLSCVVVSQKRRGPHGRPDRQGQARCWWHLQERLHSSAQTHTHTRPHPHPETWPPRPPGSCGAGPGVHVGPLPALP